MTHGIDILYWALSIVFCLALLFAILLWCRSWRREERDAAAQQVQLLAQQVRRLTEAIEMLDHTAASLQTADEQLTRHLETLRGTAQNLKRRPQPVEAPAQQAAPAERTVPETTDETDDRYEQARKLLRAGRDPVEVARRLDLGQAEVRMIARLLKNPDQNA